MKAVILAAGKGKRLGHITKDNPKPMLMLNGKPILEHNILMCRIAGIKDIFINLHYLPGNIKSYFKNGAKFGVNITYNYEQEILGTAGAMLSFLDKLKEEPYYVIYGDNYTEFDLRDLKAYHESVKSEFTIVLHWADDIRQSGLAELDQDGMIFNFIEKPQLNSIEGGWVNSGIYYINPGVIDDLVSKNSDFAYDIIPKIIKRKQKLYGYKIENGLLAIDTPDLFSKTIDKLNVN